MTGHAGIPFQNNQQGQNIAVRVIPVKTGIHFYFPLKPPDLPATTCRSADKRAVRLLFRSS